MSLLIDICNTLNQTNPFSLDNAQDTSSRLCHAWFISKMPSHSDYLAAIDLLKEHQQHPVVQFANQSLPYLEKELADKVLPEEENPLWALFSPEAIECKQVPSKVRDTIQHNRTLRDITKAQDTITDVANEVLLTSNVLLTIPLDGDDIHHLKLDDAFYQVIESAQMEPQQYWYDHPIPIGIRAEENEILYGLKHLDNALAFEVARGTMQSHQKLTVALSCSVTHPALAQIAKTYVEHEIKQHLTLKHIEVAVFGEQECQSILSTAFPDASDDLKGVFGVNGAYGRHYTFLKAVAPLWQKAVNPNLKATFKIDLDQVFVQSMLIAETGKSFFELVVQSNWGATAVDASGHRVKLGMLAGGLVNESDAERGLFTPDVNLPSGNDYAIFEQLFCARWSQAISTQEEIVSKRSDIQRVHVTGGTNGILIESLYTFRPFTPTFIHRAEDQAFILSALAHSVDGTRLVYSHQPGLIMRHDKDAFAGRAMQVAESGKALGDIERVLLFSHYAKHHPLGVTALKQTLYPFTGTFISQTPVTLALVRFLLEGSSKNSGYLDSGALRLANCLDYCENSLQQEIHSNEKGWNEYYDTLADTKKFPEKAIQAISNCLLSVR